jgi:hypothetical protein
MPRKPARSPSPRLRGEARSEVRDQALASRRGSLSRVQRVHRNDTDASPHLGRGKSYRMRGD